MTPIPSNTNLLLFNIENNNQLLRLSYSDRFTSLLKYQTVSKQKSLPYKVYLSSFVLQNFVLENDANFHKKKTLNSILGTRYFKSIRISRIERLEKSAICSAKVNALIPQSILLLPLIFIDPYFSKALTSKFSKEKIANWLKGPTLLKKKDIRNLYKIEGNFHTNLRFVTSSLLSFRTSPLLSLRSLSLLSLRESGKQSFYKESGNKESGNKASLCLRSFQKEKRYRSTCRTSPYKSSTCLGSLRKQGEDLYITPKVIGSPNKQKKNVKEEVFVLAPKEKNKALGKQDSKKSGFLNPSEQNKDQRNIDSIRTFLISDNYNNLKEKAYVIKQFAPALRIWSFAFGSTFFLIAITSILQRQEQNRWFLSFSRSVFPGLYLTSEESSWECFENITLKYLSKKSLPYRSPNTKNLVKKIDCYKDILYMDLAESWNQQAIQNYTAVFSKNSNFTQSQSALEEKGQTEKKDENVTKFHLVPYFSPRREIANFFFLNKKSSLKAEWIVQPWYQICARIPPKKEITKNVKAYNQDDFKINPLQKTFSPNRKSFFKPKLNRYKKRVSIENDSIPSKMSSSATSNYKRWTLGSKELDFCGSSASSLTKSNNFRSKKLRFSSFAPAKPSESHFLCGSSASSLTKSNNFRSRESHFRVAKATEVLQSKALYGAKATKVIDAKRNSHRKASLDKNVRYPFLKKKVSDGVGVKNLLLRKKPFCDGESSDFHAQRADALRLNDVKLSNSMEKGKAKNYIDSPNDIIKNLFYESDNFCVEPKAFSLTSKNTDFLPEQSLSFKDIVQPSSKLTQGSKKPDFCGSGAKSNPLHFLSLLKKKNNEMWYTSSDLARKKGESVYVNTLGKESAKASAHKEAFEKVIYRDRFSFLQKESFFGLPSPSFRDRSSLKVAPFFCKVSFDSLQAQASGNSLIYDKNPQIKIDLEQKDHLSKSRSFWHDSNIGVTTPTNSYRHFKESRLKKGEKISSYFLFKRKTVSNRFMSGYQQPETTRLRIKRGKKKSICRGNSGIEFSIKVSAAVPFYESGLKSLKYAFNQALAEPITFLQKKVSYKGHINQKVKREKKEKLVSRIKSIVKLKKMPYKELSLYEKGEVEPLFEQVNKTFYLSPYRFAFKKSLFADYNDYLSWPKDNPVAISISPFIETSLDEEKRAVKDSWLSSSPETKGKTGFAFVPSTPGERRREAELSQKPGSPPPLERSLRVRTSEPSDERNANMKKADSESLDDKSLRLENQELRPSKKPSQKKEKEMLTVFDEDVEQSELQKQKRTASESPARLSMRDPKEIFPVESSNIGEEEEKKKEITKSEWLEQIRESEQSLEKRKDLQKLAYPHKKALVNRSLQKSPGKIQNLLVSDRKSSFFGITNLFPKRLISEDQKQIAFKILREGLNQKSVSLLESLNHKSDEKSLSFPEEVDLFDTKREESFNEGFAPFAEGLQSYALMPLSNKYKSEICKEATGNGHGLTSKGDRLPMKVCTCTCKPLSFKTRPTKIITRQHPIYTPNRRLRLRVPQPSLSTQNSNNQARIDDLNLNSSHRWWQKRRVSSSLLGAPSKRYLVMPEISPQDWRKIIEWQLKIYFLEEEKRLLQMQTEKKVSSEKKALQREAFFGNAEKSFITQASDTKQLFTIKKLAIYLPWTSLKKSLKKPFEWPVTLLSYSSSLQPQKSGLFSAYNPFYFQEEKNKGGTPKVWFCSKNTSLNSRLKAKYDLSVANKSKQGKTPMQNFIRNKKTDSCFVSSISPPFKSASFFVYRSNLSSPLCLSKNSQKLFLTKNVYTPEKAKVYNTESDGFASSRFALNKGSKEPDFYGAKANQSNFSKPFLFEAQTQSSFLLLHGLFLVIGLKIFLGGLCKIFGTLILSKIKNSSLSVLLLPLFFNSLGSSNRLYSFDSLKTRAKHLADSEETISSLSEIVWYLRNSCRGRLVPRGVVLVEKTSSESTNFLKAIGGEAQVPVIVQSLRALPYTQNHPQRQLEKILTFAQKRAPCILFLDDLDSIGQSRTLLLKNNEEPDKSEIGINTFKSWRKKTQQSEKYWVRNFPPLSKGFTKHLPQSKFLKAPILFGERVQSKAFFDEEKASFDKKVSGCKSSSCSFHKKDYKASYKSKICTCSSLSCKSKICTCKGGGEKRKWKRYKNNLDKPFPVVTKTIDPSHLGNANSCKASYSNNSFLDKGKRINGSSYSRLPIEDLYAKVSTDSEKASYKYKICRPKYDDSLKNLSELEKTKITPFDAHLETEKVVEQRRVDLMLRLLTVMDGISGLNGVLIVTTSKNPSLLDPALLRPGRFEKLIHLKLPTKKKRILLLKRESARLGHTNPMPWDFFGRQTQDMTGSDIASAVNHSAFRAIIRSTVHSFSTLEYGINRVTRSCKAPIYKTICTKDKFLVHNAELKAQKNFALVSLVRKNFYSSKKLQRRPNRKWLQSSALFALLSQKENKDKQTMSGEISSQIYFYNAGKEIVRALILGSSLYMDRSQKKYLIRTDFAKETIRLYGGQAALALYLDSISCLKNKWFSNTLLSTQKRPLALQSTFSYKEGFRASSIIKNLTDHFCFYPKTKEKLFKKIVNRRFKSRVTNRNADQSKKRVLGGGAYLFAGGDDINFSCYNMVLSCFYVAFQNCTENRELLDYVTDHLIRFKVLKLHEMLRIVLFYY